MEPIIRVSRGRLERVGGVLSTWLRYNWARMVGIVGKCRRLGGWYIWDVGEWEEGLVGTWEFWRKGEKWEG